ncbi:ATP-dependent DNA helicase [Peribacillus alkalitolerans]|uniref:ATP-dependent DNA helicase n=1 Tax=Peribacillus alkalitolerans TaxID=1550385 RepID=UPI0013D217C8|nr:ATP-dependent DNA helicase [Peribacillus alkalitolerans]
MLKTLPFTVSKTDSFYDKFSEWIGDVFYDILPDKGFELRDEQVYMAFQMEKAVKDKQVIFAEAGVGTGKTLVYLLYAICYARYMNKPAIISCADETLIEQLVKEEGDIAKIKKALGLEIDVRMAKARDQYLCLKKLDRAIDIGISDNIDQVYDELPPFVHDTGSMVSYEVYGDRKQYSYLNDEDWSHVGWDQLQNCVSCDKRHRCGQTLSRDFYRKSMDLIICSHDFFMEHVWTKESRKREGQLPLLPDYSCVVFDEGHLLEFAAQKALTYKISENTISTILENLMANDVREETLYQMEDLVDYNVEFFSLLSQISVPVKGSDRHEITDMEKARKVAAKLHSMMDQLQESLVFEAELYTINEYDLKISEEYLDQISHSLSLFITNLEAISWFEQLEDTRNIVIMPRLVNDILSEQVFSKKVPYIFSSATLSENGSFEYIAKSLGVKEYLSFSVASPFDYEEVMAIHTSKLGKEELDKKLQYTLNSIEENNGSTLVLFSSKEDLLKFKEMASSTPQTVPFYYEGDEEISTLVKKFQETPQSVLLTYHLWEGLDVPGESLKNVIIYSLPYPPQDPVFQAKRKASSDSFNEVDLPYMILRLRQGIGRLIRTSEDSGSIHIFIEPDIKEEVLNRVLEVLPVTPKI